MCIQTSVCACATSATYNCDQYLPRLYSFKFDILCGKINIISDYFVSDLNALPDRPQEKRVEIVGATNAPMTVKLVPNYADNPLVCGPRYTHDDFRCSWATHLGSFTSGILCKHLNC